MIQTALIPDAHDDLVTDVAYDMYGLSLATCGLDQRIKVWLLDETTGTWNLEDDWKAHDAAITKLTWAHATFGTILASASFDRTVKIWEQVPIERAEIHSAMSASALGSGGAGVGGVSTRWVERATLLDARGSVRAVEFAPHHLGLKLAAISSDNCLRIYECFEQPACATWQTAEEFDVHSLPSISSSSVVQGSTGSHTATLTASTPIPAQPIVAGAVDSASVAGLLQAAQQQSAVQAGVGRPGTGAREADGGWCVSWCKERYWGEVIAVGAGVGGVVKIIQFSPHRRPQTLLSLEPPPPPPPPPPATTAQGGISRTGTGALRSNVPYAVAAASGIGASSTSSSLAPHATSSTSAVTVGAPSVVGAAAGSVSSAETQRYAVTSVAWAPSCGRSYHLIATGSRDGHVRIWKVKPPAPSVSSVSAFATTGSGGPSFSMVAEGERGDADDGDETVWSAILVADFDDHKSTVGRVEWNITGTVLSSAGNDGRVRLWKRTAGGVWRPAGHISVEQEEEHAEHEDVDMDDMQGGAD